LGATVSLTIYKELLGAPVSLTIYKELLGATVSLTIHKELLCAAISPTMTAPNLAISDLMESTGSIGTHKILSYSGLG